ncbi:STAS domain-containing protein [bacterium]|nr:STAS domain-containing protein [bacterium]
MTADTSIDRPILIIRPTLKIAGGFISVCEIAPDGTEAEMRKLDVTGAPDHEWPGLFELVEKELAAGRRRFIVDLSRVPWMNSRGLGRLIELWRTIGQAGGKASLVCAEGRILTILEISQVDRIVKPVLSVADAVTAVAGAAAAE